MLRINPKRLFIGVFFSLAASLMPGCSGTYSDAPTSDREDPQVNTATPDPFGIYELLSANQYQGSVLVFDKDMTVISGGFGYASRTDGTLNDDNTSFRIGSVSKQFTAMAILILQERGLIAIEDPVSKYLSGYPNGERITIKQLLNHTSGIPNYTDFAFYPSVVEQPHTPQQVIEYFMFEPLDFAPGHEFRYSNSGYVILGEIIQSVSQMSYTEFLRQEVFVPLDMSHSGYLDLEENNIDTASGYLSNYAPSPFIHPTLPSADGGLVSSVTDLLKWHRALRENALINENSTKLMFTPALENAALGWFVANYFNTSVYFHGGGYSGFRAGIYHYPAQERLIVLLSNSEDTDINTLAKRIDELIR